MATRFGPSLATKTNVTGTAASISLVAANPRRKGLTLFNDSGVTADIDLSGGTASATSCSLSMVDQSYYELPTMANESVYTGAITGIWASGQIRVTEFE
jgi:hypothetical protein